MSGDGVSNPITPHIPGDGIGNPITRRLPGDGVVCHSRVNRSPSKAAADSAILSRPSGQLGPGQALADSDPAWGPEGTDDTGKDGRQGFGHKTHNQQPLLKKSNAETFNFEKKVRF